MSVAILAKVLCCKPLGRYSFRDQGTMSRNAECFNEGVVFIIGMTYPELAIDDMDLDYDSKEQSVGRFVNTELKQFSLETLTRAIPSLVDGLKESQRKILFACFKKFDGSKYRKRHGRPPVTPEIETLTVSMAKDNPSWGYDRISGAIRNLGHNVSDQTIGNILARNGIAPSDDRKKKRSRRNTYTQKKATRRF